MSTAERRPPGCFGKLPVHGDFVRHNASLPEVEAWDRWWQEGITLGRQSFGSEWDARFEEMRPTCFVLQLRATKPVVIGVCVPSRDKAGRRYPFSIFQSFGEESVGAGDAWPRRFGAARVFWRAAGALAAEGLRTNDLRGFLDAVTRASVALQTSDTTDDVGARIGSLSAESFWTDLFGSFEDPRKYALAQNIDGLFASGAAPRLAVHFPPGRDAADHVFFSTWIEKLSRGRTRPTLCAWSEERPDPLRMLFDDLAGRNLLPMIDPTCSSDRVCRVASDGLENATRQAQAQDRFGAVLDNPDLDGAQMLEGLLSLSRHA